MFRLLLLVYIRMSIPIDVQYSDRNSYAWFILLPCIWQVFYSHFIIFASKGCIVEHLSTCRGRNNMYHKEEFFWTNSLHWPTYNIHLSLFSFIHASRFLYFVRIILYITSLSLSLSREKEWESREPISLLEEDLVGEYIVVLSQVPITFKVTWSKQIVMLAKSHEITPLRTIM